MRGRAKQQDHTPLSIIVDDTPANTRRNASNGDGLKWVSYMLPVSEEGSKDRQFGGDTGPTYGVRSQQGQYLDRSDYVEGK